MNPTQLLNQHLDNVAIRLRPTKPYDPSKFDSLKQIERQIVNKPVEHMYVIDSTGMPIGRAVGSADRVTTPAIAPDPFAAPPAIITHNHPSEAQINRVSEYEQNLYNSLFDDEIIRQKQLGLSAQDLYAGAVNNLPQRAVIPETMEVHQFNPGGLHPTIIDQFRGDMTSGDISPQRWVNETIERYPSEVKYYRKDAQRQYGVNPQEIPDTISPSYTVTPLDNSYRSIPMAEDSFAIKRTESPSVATDPNKGNWRGGGTYGSYGYRDW